VRHHPARDFTLAASLLILTACGSDSPAEPDPTPDPDPGSIEVSATTTGPDLDGDGYSLDANGAVLALAANGTATYTDLAPGSYTVELSGVADNCEVTSDNPVSVTVVSLQTATAAFTVECARIPGPMTLVAADENGEIYGVNEDTGLASLLFETSTSDGAGGFRDVGVVSSMLYVPQTDKWWLGTGGRAWCEGCIQSVDPLTGVATTLNDSVFSRGGVSGLTMHPTSERIFTFESDASSDVFELDPVTGGVTLVSDQLSVNSAGKGTTFTLSGDLYVVGDGELYTADPDAGTSSLIGTVTYEWHPVFQSGSPDILSMATRSDGVIFALLRDGRRSQGYSTYLVTLNVETAVASLVGETLANLEGLSYVPTSMITQ